MEPSAASSTHCTTQDLVSFPLFTFGDVEKYAKVSSGCDNVAKAYKFFAEPGYLHDIKLSIDDNKTDITARCFRSMKKNDPPHQMKATVSVAGCILNGTCSCVAGLSGYCHHVVGLLFYLAHCKQLGLNSLPDDLTCTSMQQRWSIPRGKKIEQKEIQEILVKKPQIGANYNKFIKSTLYSPCPSYPFLCKEVFSELNPEPLMMSLLPTSGELASLEFSISKFGKVPKGSVLSYQQKYSQEYIINDYTCTGFPQLPLESSEKGFQNHYTICLEKVKLDALTSLQINRETAIEVERRTITQAASSMWHSMRSKRITASKFGLIAKRISHFDTLRSQLYKGKQIQTAAMKRGITMEPKAAMVYSQSAKNGTVNLFPSGLIINPKSPWLGCSPDRKVFDLEAISRGENPFGLLEIKVAKEGECDFGNVAYLEECRDMSGYKLKRSHIYHYQVQCQLALAGMEWCDFFSFIDEKTFVCERIKFDAGFFQEAKDKVDMFFFNYFLI